MPEFYPVEVEEGSQTVEIIEVPRQEPVPVTVPVAESAGSFVGLVAGASAIAVSLSSTLKKIGIQLMQSIGTISAGLSVLSKLMDKEAKTVEQLAGSLEVMQNSIKRLESSVGESVVTLREATVTDNSLSTHDASPTVTDNSMVTVSSEEPL